MNWGVNPPNWGVNPPTIPTLVWLLVIGRLGPVRSSEWRSNFEVEVIGNEKYRFCAIKKVVRYLSDQRQMITRPFYP